jgi:hypothetical protein
MAISRSQLVKELEPGSKRFVWSENTTLTKTSMLKSTKPSLRTEPLKKK